MTDVRWSARMGGALDPFVNDHLTLVFDPWAELPGNAATTVQLIAEDYFDERTWREHFGDDWTAAVELAVTEPPHIAGTWLVEMSLEVQAGASRVQS